MNQKIESGRTRLLLVEGNDEKEFFIQLHEHLDISSLYIMVYEGKDKLQSFLALIRNDPQFLSVTHIGIIHDADFDGSAFQQIQTALKKANTENPDRLQYPELTQLMILHGNKPKVGTFIMPDQSSDGMLETLILKALNDDDVMACVDDYFNCIQQQDITTKQEHLSKAQMRVYIEGKNVNSATIRSDRKRSYLSAIYKMSWWNWDHQAFNDVKAFITQLAAD